MSCIISVESLKSMVDFGLVVREELAKYNLTKFESRFSNSQPMIRIEEKVDLEKLFVNAATKDEAGI